MSINMRLSLDLNEDTNRKELPAEKLNEIDEDINELGVGVDDHRKIKEFKIE